MALLTKAGRGRASTHFLLMITRRTGALGSREFASMEDAHAAEKMDRVAPALQHTLHIVLLD